MVTTSYVRECITVPEKTSQIRELIAAGGSQYGMQTFDQSLFGLLKGGLISMETALQNASNPDDFSLKLAGVSSSADPARDQMAGIG